MSADQPPRRHRPRPGHAGGRGAGQRRRRAALWSNGVFSSRRRRFLPAVCKIVGDRAGRAGHREAANGMVFVSVGQRARPGRRRTASMPCRWTGGAPAQAGRRAEGFSSPRHRPLSHAGRQGPVPDGGEPARQRHASASTVSKSPMPDGAPTLVAQGTIEGGLLINPQDVAAAGPGSFYVANGTRARIALMPLCRRLSAAGRRQCAVFQRHELSRSRCGRALRHPHLMLTPDGTPSAGRRA